MTSPSAAQNHVETRLHEMRKRRIQMIDGNLTVNARIAEGGASMRLPRIELVQPAATMISGNVAQLLRDVTAVSRERIDSGSLLLPWLRIGGLHFS